MGPGPFAGMMLADMGASVVRVDRVPVYGAVMPDPKFDVLGRGKRSIAIDLKSPSGVEILLRLVESAVALIDPFRPKVAERLGIGPDECMARNPALVYGRITGWGQEGPYSDRAGHDINYIALAGALHPIGILGGPPVVPLNLIGDFGGGGMLLAYGLLCGIFESVRSGAGQVVDAAMVDGSALLTAKLHGMIASGQWNDERGTNLLDGGAHFYGVYETADQRYLTVGAIEPKFYRDLLRLIGLDDGDLSSQEDRSQWLDLRSRLADVFRSRTLQEWCSVLEDTDACFAPVLAPGEAPRHSHNRTRHTFIRLKGVVQPAPAPRFSRTSPSVPDIPCSGGAHTEGILRSVGFSEMQIEDLRASGSVF